MYVWYPVLKLHIFEAQFFLGRYFPNNLFYRKLKKFKLYQTRI